MAVNGLTSIDTSGLSSKDVSSMTHYVSELLDEVTKALKIKNSSEKDRKELEKQQLALTKQLSELTELQKTETNLRTKKDKLTGDQLKKAQEVFNKELANQFNNLSKTKEGMNAISLIMASKLGVSNKFKSTSKSLEDYIDLVEKSAELKQKRFNEEIKQEKILQEEEKKRAEEIKKHNKELQDARNKVFSTLKSKSGNLARTLAYDALGPLKILTDPIFGGKDGFFSALSSVKNAIGFKKKTGNNSPEDFFGSEVHTPKRGDLIKNGGTVGKAAGYLADVIEDSKNNCCCDDDNDWDNNKKNPLTDLIPGLETVFDTVRDVGKVLIPGIGIGFVLNGIKDGLNIFPEPQPIPAPVVNVSVPGITVPQPAVTVNVPAPIVNVTVPTEKIPFAPSAGVTTEIPKVSTTVEVSSIPEVTTSTSKSPVTVVDVVPNSQPISTPFKEWLSSYWEGRQKSLDAEVSSRAVEFYHQRQEENKKRRRWLVDEMIRTQGANVVNMNAKEIADMYAWSNLGITEEYIKSVVSGQIKEPLLTRAGKAISNAWNSFWYDYDRLDAGAGVRSVLNLMPPLMGMSTGMGFFPLQDAIIYKDNSVYVPHPDDNIVLTKDEVSTTGLSSDFESSLFNILNTLAKKNSTVVPSFPTFDFSLLRV